MFSLTLIFTALLCLTASNALPTNHVQNLQARTCGNTSDAVPFFAANGGPIQDYVASTQVAAMTSLIGAQGFNFLGVTARVFTTQELSTVPLYMVYLVTNGAVSDHIYTVDQGEYQALLEIGYRDEGIQAYVYPTQICGSVPWYAVYNAAATEHFFTTDEATRASFLATAGWTDQGIVAYVLPPNCVD